MRALTKSLTVVAALSIGLVATGCTQGGGEAPAEEGTATTESTEEAEVVEATGDAPEPFAGGNVEVAIVQQSGQGDYFQQYLNGTKQQAEAMGVKLSVYDAKGDNAQQASQLDQAIASGVDGIVVRHGFPDTLCPGVNKAIEQGIPVVIYDVEIQQCAEDAIQTQQSDALMASLVLDRMYEDIGAGVEVGYVNVAGIAPLDRRDVVWREMLEQADWQEMFKTGAFTDSSATDSAPMVTAAVQSNPGVAAIYAPYDEFTKGTLTGLDQIPGTEDIKVYGADISNADIELMRADGSRWVATGATDPNAIGAAVLRTLFLHMAGELQVDQVDFPPILVTQEMLRDNDITNMEGLREKFPELNISDVSSADWIPSVAF